MELWLLFTIPALVMAGWFYTTFVIGTQFPTLRGKAIVLLIAHPDDEAMFFSPTVLSLTQPKLGNHLKILCLSNGNADGLGETRTREIEASALLLGVRSSADVHVHESPEFEDSMTKTWSPTAIASLLNSVFVKEPSKTRKQANISESPPTTTIDVLITFDKYGISSHPNHISLYHGAVEWVKGLMKGKAGYEAPVSVLTLTTTNIIQKYIGGFDMPLAMFKIAIAQRGEGGRANPNNFLFVNNIFGYRTAQRAMTKAHKSQMRWFRWGWISIGRYMVVNDLKREKIV